jgi:hypothetical protein
MKPSATQRLSDYLHSGGIRRDLEGKIDPDVLELLTDVVAIHCAAHDRRLASARGEQSRPQQDSSRRAGNDDARLRRKHLKLDLIYGALAVVLFGFMALAFFLNE